MGKQERSGNTYQKINTIFKRDDHNCIMPYDGYVMPELEWLKDCKFAGEEKIDGTNIRIEVAMKSIMADVEGNVCIDWKVEYKGKTDKAEIPAKLKAFLEETYPSERVLSALGLSENMCIGHMLYLKEGMEVEANEVAIERKWVKFNSKGVASNIFDEDRVPMLYTLYGEGYGAGIQSGGYYRKDNSFIGFDVKVDDMYLLREQRDEIFNKLGCPIVPFMGYFTVEEAVEFVKKGFKSQIAEEEHLAEGLVLRTPDGLCNRRGERIMFKVKTCDWDKYFAVYKTYDRVEQNPHKE